MSDGPTWCDKYNKMHIELVAESRAKRVSWLVDMLTAAKDTYYGSGESIMSDADYDRFERFLRTNEPDHPFLNKVGAAPKMPTPAGFPLP